MRLKRAVRRVRKPMFTLSTAPAGAVFEEGGFPDTEYMNIYGSMTKDGVPKPVWRAFQLLHTHAGDTRVNTTLTQPSAAAAAETAAAVEHPAQTCSELPGTNFEGGDILPNSQHLVLPDAAACCAACQNHSGTSPETRCQLWTWASPKSSCCAGRCYLKQATTSPHKRADPTMTSGYVGAAPPPPPPPGPKPQISAFSTVNATAGVGSLRVFLGFWGNPQQDSANPVANRTVTVSVTHPSGQAPGATATLYQIGGGVCDPRSAWEAMGSPANPNPAQLATLNKASEYGTSTVATAAAGPTKTTVTLEMSENTAYVVAFAA